MIKHYEYYVYVHKDTKQEYSIDDLQKKYKLPLGKKLWNIIRYHYRREVRSRFMEV